MKTEQDTISNIVVKTEEMSNVTTPAVVKEEDKSFVKLEETVPDYDGPRDIRVRRMELAVWVQPTDFPPYHLPPTPPFSPSSSRSSSPSSLPPPDGADGDGAP